MVSHGRRVMGAKGRFQPYDVALGHTLLQLVALGDVGPREMGDISAAWVYQHHAATGLSGRFLNALTKAQR
jgi:hypothetical protein